MRSVKGTWSFGASLYPLCLHHDLSVPALVDRKIPELVAVRRVRRTVSARPELDVPSEFEPKGRARRDPPRDVGFLRQTSGPAG